MPRSRNCFTLGLCFLNGYLSHLGELHDSTPAASLALRDGTASEGCRHLSTDGLNQSNKLQSIISEAAQPQG